MNERTKMAINEAEAFVTELLEKIGAGMEPTPHECLYALHLAYTAVTIAITCCESEATIVEVTKSILFAIDASRKAFIGTYENEVRVSDIVNEK